MTRRLAAVVALCTCLGAPSIALAQPAADPVVTAERLFEEGRKLLDAGRAGEACPKFEASQQLDPALGTLLNLAACYEAVGKLASALRAFRDAEAQARAAGEPKREKVAADRARDLDARVPRLTIEVGAAARPDGFAVFLDDQAVPDAQLGVATPIDPGTVVVSATAPGFERFDKKLSFSADQTSATVEIPALTPAASAAEPGERTIYVDGKPVVINTERRRSRTRTIAGLAIAGAGAIMFGSSVALALGAKGDYDDAIAEDCAGSPDTCSASGVSRTDDARGRGNLATAVGLVGLAAVAGGLVLWLTAPEEEVQRTALVPQISPQVFGDGVGLAVLGSF